MEFLFEMILELWYDLLRFIAENKKLTKPVRLLIISVPLFVLIGLLGLLSYKAVENEDVLPRILFLASTGFFISLWVHLAKKIFKSESE